MFQFTVFSEIITNYYGSVSKRFMTNHVIYIYAFKLLYRVGDGKCRYSFETMRLVTRYKGVLCHYCPYSHTLNSDAHLRISRKTQRKIWYSTKVYYIVSSLF